MIRFVQDQREQQDFYKICQGSAFGCKLAAIALAYGFHQPFAQFWLSESGSSQRARAAFCLLDGVLSIAGVPQDQAETMGFVRTLGASRVFCSAKAAERLGLWAAMGGPVLEKRLPPGAGGDHQGLSPPEAVPSLVHTHRLLERAGMALAFEPFYLDLSHRLRHGQALAVGEYSSSGSLTGCAVVSAITEEAAVLSALAVDKPFRRQGLGTRLVGRVEQRLPGRKLYVLRQAGENQEFYAGLGFREKGRWVEAGDGSMLAERQPRKGSRET